jgi:hypothetical protein
MLERHILNHVREREGDGKRGKEGEEGRRNDA